METKSLKLGYHLVVFLDVLGQRAKFKGLRIPTNAHEAAQVKEVLEQTAGFVLDLRSAFQADFETFEKGMNMGAHRSGPLRPSFVGFSDSFVTSVPLRSEGADLVPAINSFSALAAAAGVMRISLANKHPLRGGIDVGLATEIWPGEIYGNALELAYLLECKTARYPRIVIGDGLWNYLDSVLAEFGKRELPIAKAITNITERTKGLIATDTDGTRILDYLGIVMVGASPHGYGQRVVRPAYEFVLAEESRLTAEGDHKLAERYASLRSYFESRLSLWGLSAWKS
jgi:hypothetical protein